MAPTPQPNPADATPVVTDAASTDAEPPDDFGAAIIAEFAKRQEQAAAAAPVSDDGAPPGGWPPQEVPATTTPAAPATPATPAAEPAASVTAAESATEGATPAAVSGDAPAPTSGPGGADATPTASATGDAGQQPDGAAEPGPAAPSGYTWSFHDGTTERQAVFSDAEVQRAISLAAWAEQLPQETRDAVGALEAGQAVAIPRADYDQFIAWKGQQTRTQRDADLASLDVEPEVAKLIGDLRDQVVQLQQGQPAQQPSLDPAYEQAAYSELSAMSDRIAQAQTEYAQSHGLSAAEVEGLMNTVVRAEIIPHLMERNSVYNPVTGALVRRGDAGMVATQALDWALVQNPDLRTRALTAVSAAPPASPPPGGNGQGAPGTPSAIDQKKARAASLATAPSGATAPPPATVKQMSETDRVAAMAREIEQALAAS